MNKTVKVILIVFAVIAVAVIGAYIYKGLGENNLSSLPTYTYEEDPSYTRYTQMEGIEFSYPSSYTAIGTTSQPAFMSSEHLGTSVNLVYEDTQNLSFENYVKLSIDNIKKALSVNGDIEESYINLNGVKAAKLDYVAEQNGLEVKLTQVIVVKSGTAYILTVGCLAKDEATMKPEMEKMIKSFK